MASSSEGLILSGLYKTLKGKPSPASSGDASKTNIVDDEEWEDLDLRAESAISLSLEKNIL